MRGVVHDVIRAAKLVGGGTADDGQISARSRRPRGTGIDGIAVAAIAVDGIARSIALKGEPLAEEFTWMLVAGPPTITI